MFGVLAKRLFGSANDRFLKGLNSTVAATNALEPELQELSDEVLRARTAELRGRLDAGESLDDILPDAFATVREAAKRTLGQRSEEHTSELQSLMRIPYAVFCFKKKKE